MVEAGEYLFVSDRIGFRTWTSSDLVPLSQLNADTNVMAYFQSVQTTEQTQAFIHKMNEMFAQKRYCYFAVDRLTDQRFMGFIGLADVTFEADFTPCVDIGWRLDPEVWNQGFATEGAKRCLQYGFESVLLNDVVSVAPLINTPSIRVMQKIGMQKKQLFEHPLLTHFPPLAQCVLYQAQPENII